LDDQVQVKLLSCEVRERLKLGDDLNKRYSIKELIQKYKANRLDLEEFLNPFSSEFIDDFLTDLFYEPFI